MPRRPIIISSLALALASCKFPYPDDVNDDGRPLIDGGATDALLNDTTQAATPLIAFTSNRSGNDEIFTMRVDGSIPTNLTNNSAADTSPVWAPAGDRIAFLSTRTGTQELYVMYADGTNVINVSHGQAEYPVWAPDGERVAFSSTRSGRAQLYVGFVDGSQPSPVTQEGATSTYLEADWSPAGNRIACATGDTLLVINPDLTNRQVFGSGAIHLTPRWSPDGRHLAFLSRPSLFYELFVIGSDGTNLTNLTNTPMANETEPSWAASSDTLAIVGGAGGNTDIAIVTVPGGGRADRTMSADTESHPRWSADGSLIVFEASGDISTVPAHGPRTVTRLTNDPATDRQPTWRPAS